MLSKLDGNVQLSWNLEWVACSPGESGKIFHMIVYPRFP